MDLSRVKYASKCRHVTQAGWCAKCNLHAAAEQGDVKSVAALLAAGADPNYQLQLPGIGSTQGAPLHWAAQFHSRESAEDKSILIMELLLAHGVEIDLQNQQGQTPLHLAVASGHRAIVKYLLENGADVNRRHIEGNTPLHTVVLSDIQNCGQNRIEIARLLLRHGADRNIRNNSGQRPLECGRKENISAVVPAFAEVLKPPESPKQTSQTSPGPTAPAAGPAKASNSVGNLPIVCACGQCGSVKSEYAGKTVTCPKCQRKLKVPG